MTELKLFMQAYHMPRVKCKRLLNFINKQNPSFKREFILLAKERIHMLYIGDKPGEGSNPGEELINVNSNMCRLSQRVYTSCRQSEEVYKL